MHLTCQSLTSLLLINIAIQVESAWPVLPLPDLLHGVLQDTKCCVQVVVVAEADPTCSLKTLHPKHSVSKRCIQVVVVAEADPASIRLEDREDLHVKPDPDAMSDGHANGIEIKACAFLCQ